MSKKRIRLREIGEEIVVSFTFQQAFDYFSSAKRKTTLTTYNEQCKFFTEWLKITNHVITLVSVLSVVVVREYINYIREDHYTFISNAQTARRNERMASGVGKWSTTLQGELQFMVGDLTIAGYSLNTTSQVLEQQYKMLDTLGVKYERIDY